MISNKDAILISERVGHNAREIPDTNGRYWLTKTGDLFRVSIKAIYVAGCWQKRIATKQLMPRGCSRHTVKFAFPQSGKRRDVALSTLMLEVFKTQ